MSTLPAQAALTTYVVKSPINFDGKGYAEGDPIQLNVVQAEKLLRQECIGHPDGALPPQPQPLNAQLERATGEGLAVAVDEALQALQLAETDRDAALARVAELDALLSQANAELTGLRGQLTTAQATVADQAEQLERANGVVNELQAGQAKAAEAHQAELAALNEQLQAAKAATATATRKQRG